MPIPQTGDAAPSFELQDQQGRTVKLSDFAGKNVVLYFYPKDDTPGCTVEACNFRDEHSTLEAAGAVVLGVSPDDEKSHQKFTAKFNLPFPLLVDEGHKVADAYGVWGEKQFAGRSYMGIIRATFLIGPDGKLARVWPKVKVEGHVDEVLAALGATPSRKPTVEVATTPAAAPQAPLAPEATRTARSTERQLSAPGAKPAAKKAAAKKAPAAKKGAAKKAPATKKAAAKKAPAAKKGAAKKATAAKKGAAKKAVASKGAAKKAGAKKAAAKKAPAAKKGAGQRPTLVGRARAIAQRLLPRRR